MSAAGRRRTLLALAAFVALLAGAVLLHRALRFEPPRRVWVGNRIEPGGAVRILDGLFDAPGGRSFPEAVADGSDRSLTVWFGGPVPRSRGGASLPPPPPRDGIAAALRRALGLAPRGCDYSAAPDVVTIGDTEWFPYDRER